MLASGGITRITDSRDCKNSTNNIGSLKLDRWLHGMKSNVKLLIHFIHQFLWFNALFASQCETV